LSQFTQCFVESNIRALFLLIFLIQIKCIHFSGQSSLKETGVAQSVWRLGYGLNDRDSVPDRGSDRIFLFATASRPALGPTQPHIQRVTGSLMRGAILPFLQYVFLAWCLLKHRDELNFLPFKPKEHLDTIHFPSSNFVSRSSALILSSHFLLGLPRNFPMNALLRRSDHFQSSCILPYQLASTHIMNWTSKNTCLVSLTRLLG
jgi:hypothetical protein